MRTGERKQRSIFGEALFAGAVALFFLIWNPFDLWSRFDAGGRAVLLNVLSVEYPEDRPRTAVVLAGDDFTDAWGYAWPLPFEAHSEILALIGEQAPAAVFIDFLFIDRRESNEEIAAFARAIDALAENTQVYLAVAPTASTADREILEELVTLDRLRESVHLVSVELDPDNRVRALYPLMARDGTDQAAMALARQAVPDVAEQLASRRIRSIDFFWPAPPPFMNCQASGVVAECASLSSNAPLRAVRLLLGGLFKPNLPFAGPPEAYSLRTYPLSTLRAIDLVEGSEVRRRMLSDAYVFYGSDFDFTPDDEFTSPLYGVGQQNTLPGVFAHAVAFDNLVTLRRNVIVGPPRELSAGQLRALLVVAVLAIGALAWALISRIGDSWPLRRRLPIPIASVLASYPFGILVGFVVVAVAVFLWLRITPGYWLTVLTLANLRYALPGLNEISAGDVSKFIGRVRPRGGDG